MPKISEIEDSDKKILSLSNLLWLKDVIGPGLIKGGIYLLAGEPGIGKTTLALQLLGDRGLEAWLAGSISKEELPELWNTSADVICIRGAACKQGTGPGRFGEISTALVKQLVATIPTH